MPLWQSESSLKSLLVSLIHSVEVEGAIVECGVGTGHCALEILRCLNLIEVKEELGKIKAVKAGFEHRKDCLITLASNMRSQADPSIYIKKQELGSEKPKGCRFPG